MRSIALTALLSLPLLLLAGCGEETPLLTVPDEALFSRGPGAGPAGMLQNFTAPHSGDQEIPSVDTRARGQATFQVNKAGTEVRFRLLVANIENVTMAHIHCGSPDVNGPVIVWLYPSGPPPQLIQGRTQGVLSQGVITEADVVAQPDSEACPGGVATLADVIKKMQDGEAYSNVHTLQFPPGEIRGNIHAGGPHP
jgi:hypothetical protein